MTIYEVSWLYCPDTRGLSHDECHGYFRSFRDARSAAVLAEREERAGSTPDPHIDRLTLVDVPILELILRILNGRGFVKKRERLWPKKKRGDR